MREMDYRYVEETDQVRQTLLEVYFAVVLQTPFNDFGTHQQRKAQAKGSN